MDISHACFDHCPQLCQPLDDIITGYMMTGSKSQMREKICASKDHFDCVFDLSIVDECSKVLSMGSAIGAHLPMSESQWDYLKRSCAPLPQTEVTTAIPGPEASTDAATVAPQVAKGTPAPEASVVATTATSGAQRGEETSMAA